MNPAQSEARARAELTGQPSDHKITRGLCVAACGLVVLSVYTYRPVGSTGHTATIGGHPVPALHCVEDSALVLTPQGVVCMHRENYTLEP